MKFIISLIAHLAILYAGYCLALYDNDLMEKNSFIYQIIEGEL